MAKWPVGGESLRITLLVEGRTERAFIPYVREFLDRRLGNNKPRLATIVYHGRIPKEQKLRRTVENLLQDRTPPDCVIALTDVYTGSNDFVDAVDARRKMRNWVGNNEQFHPHAAQHDFEAWLLPYWDEIQKLAKHAKGRPPGPPESVNHNHPPSWHIKEIFRVGKGPRDYVKTRDVKRILLGKDLSIAAAACPELKSFLNTIIVLCGGDPL